MIIAHKIIYAAHVCLAIQLSWQVCEEVKLFDFISANSFRSVHCVGMMKQVLISRHPQYSNMPLLPTRCVYSATWAMRYQERGLSDNGITMTYCRLLDLFLCYIGYALPQPLLICQRYHGNLMVVCLFFHFYTVIIQLISCI